MLKKKTKSVEKSLTSKTTMAPVRTDGTNHKPTNQGLKYDTEKPRMELLDPEWLEEVAWVMTFGAKKYAANNWRSGISITRLLGAAMRHLLAILRGENTDPETGRSHSAHLACCSMFVFWTLKHRKDMDDRWTG